MPVGRNNLDRKYCPTCKALVLYDESEILCNDTCVICGDIVINKGTKLYDWMKDGYAEDIPESDEQDCNDDEISEIHITPAKQIYYQNVNTSVWFVKELYDEFHNVWLETKCPETKMQAWQYVKACVYILKERNSWCEWQNIKPGTQEWMEWWKAHPEDQRLMAAFAKAHCKRRIEEMGAGRERYDHGIY